MKRPRPKLKLQQPDDQPWVTLEFGSCLSKAREVEAAILKACNEAHFSETDLFGIKLSLEEALVNAVKHGNCGDNCKCVKVQYRVTQQRLDVTIEDQGKGFKPGDLPDPTEDNNLCMDHGRGILLMRAYMNSVVYNAKGNKVTLVKFSENGLPPAEAAMG
jgi:serine/threonine-protein kinase RsbW